MLEITVHTLLWFDGDSLQDSLYREMSCEPSTERFDSVDSLAAWLVMEGFDWQYSTSDNGEGQWSTPHHESPLSGLHEVRVACRSENMTPGEWQEVYDHLMSVKTA